MAGSGTVQSQLGTPSSSSSTQARAPVLSPSRSIASIDSRGRARGGSILSARGRAASIKSERSAYSIGAIGSVPLGSLRVHSPPPAPQVPPTTTYQHDCLKHGDVIIIRDVPELAIIGYDIEHIIIKGNTKFEGIKHLPPGPHLVWGGSNSSFGRTGFWLIVPEKSPEGYGNITVLRWDKYEETVGEEVSEAEIRIQKEGVSGIANNLHAYPGPIDPGRAGLQPGWVQLLSKEPDVWVGLSRYVTKELLNKVVGSESRVWKVSSSYDRKSTEYNLPATAVEQRKQYIDDEVFKFIFPQNSAAYTPFSVGYQRTQRALDKTEDVNYIVMKACTNENPDEILGELQFCFVTGMVVGNSACQEQWAHIVKILFQAYYCPTYRPVFFRKFIETFHFQLMYNEVALEGSIFEHDSKLMDDLRIILIRFKSRMNEYFLTNDAFLSEDQAAVATAFESLESWLWKWGWDLSKDYVRSGKIQLEDGEMVDVELKDFEAEDERGEYAPVVVDVDEEGREKGLIAL
ncbi:AAR2 protein-like protein [Xylogone sp. PMI_703]|nr:AAR2 protein-like protein [Xylogone sp. PMI_703]